MTLFMLYVDDGPMDTLAGHRGQGMAFVYCPLRLSLRGALLASHGLAINVEAAGNRFRSELDPFLHRELFRFIAMRQAAGWAPRLLFHWETSANDDIDATEVVDASVGDPAELFALLHDLSDDVILRVTVTKPPEISIPDLLDERLAEGDCPWLDGIIHGDGGIVLVRHRKDPDPQYLPSVRPLVRSSLASFWEYNVNEWTTSTLLEPRSWEAQGVRVTCGLGTLGFENVGLVVVRGFHDGKVRWAAHFEDSGPFTDARIIEGEVVVTSAQTRLRWCFPMAKPERVRVERLAPTTEEEH